MSEIGLANNIRCRDWCGKMSRSLHRIIRRLGGNVMTTPTPKTRSVAQHWEPYPDLDLEPKDMEQLPPIYDLRDKLISIFNPEGHYPYHPSIMVGGEIPIYYGPPNPRGGPPAHVIPDCLIAFDVDSDAIRRRVGYDPIQNGKPPDFVLEVGSRSTHRNDSGNKREVYRQLAVPEYWRFDSLGGRYYGEPIIGERLVNGQYQRFPVVNYPDGSVGSTSEILNLNFRWDGARFRIHDPATGVEWEHPQERGERLGHLNERLQERSELLQERNDSLQERNDFLQEQTGRLQQEVERLRAENRRLRGD